MKKRILALILCFTMVFTMTSYVGFGDYTYAAANNVHNVTKNTWHSTLSEATEKAANGNVIEVHNSFTETESVKIQKQNLTIRAAAGKSPTIKWSGTLESISVSGASTYHCVVIYTDVTTSTTFGGSTGTLIFDASGSAGIAQKGKRARVMMHCGTGTLNLKDGIVLKGGNTGGGDYHTAKSEDRKPVGSGEISGELGFGSGLFMRNGTLNMSGGIIEDNYSLMAATTDHNYVGGGGGVYLYNNTIMNMSGGIIRNNAAGSGGGGGVLVGHGSKLTVTGGEISGNVCRFASGGGIGVRTKAEVKINGGLIEANVVEGHGGGLFARGDSIPLEITGGVFKDNVAGNWGGGILFWTVGDDVTKNTVKIGGAVRIEGNTATNGAGVSVGREVLEGKPIGSKARLIVEGNPTIIDNTASNNGGGIYMQPDEFSSAVNEVVISGGNFENNAAKNGAGIYVPGGIVEISSASFVDNDASVFGGGIYVANGVVNLNSGIFSANRAKNGGAVYVTGGNINMADGAVEDNYSSGDGGALYISQGNFTMTSGKLINNKSGNEKTLSDGGGVYVEGGNITIGVQGCDGGTEGTKHTHALIDKIHPIIKCNTATDSGGGIALIGNGNINMFCANIIENHATNRGRGLNIYMELGQFNYYYGDIGSLENPELVIVGGTLNHANSTSGKLMLEYYHCNNQAIFETPHEGEFDEKVAFATKGSFYNLPDGEKYWKAPNGYRFFGWTFYGPNDVNAQSFVRNKEDYKGLGAPIKVFDEQNNCYDGNVDGKITMYALWAPDVSNIEYAAVTVVNGEYNFILDNLDDGYDELDRMMKDNPKQYTYSVAPNTNVVKEPEKAGYTFKGWYIYQNENQNANWGCEPIYIDGTLDENKGIQTLDYSKVEFIPVDAVTKSADVDFGSTNFGDVTLIARFEPAFTDLRVAKEGCDSTKDVNQTFVFQVTGTPDDTTLAQIDMTVTVHGNGSVLITDLPVGEYQVKELIEWSWRYNLDGDYDIAKPKDITLSNPEKIGITAEEVKFVNKRDNLYWLSGDSFCDNLWSGVNDSIIKRIFS